MTKTLIVNLYSGPGAGKSTLAAWLFSKLKKKGVNAELVTEYAKDVTWEESFSLLNNQIFIFANQHHRLNRLLGKVDVVITDSPIMMGVCYDQEKNTFLKNLVYNEYCKMNNLDFFLKRNTNYQQIGRNQNEEGAKEMDRIIENHLYQYNVDYTKIDVNKDKKKILNTILNKL